MGEKDGDDEDDDEGDAQGSLPESVRRSFPDRGPPSAAELEKFIGSFPTIMERYAGIVWGKIRAIVPNDTSPESLRDLHQGVFTTLFAFAKKFGVPLGMGPAITSTALYTVKNYLRVRGRAARRGAAFQTEAVFAGVGAEPRAPVVTLLNQILGQLPAQDGDLLLWDAEGQSDVEIARRLGVPPTTVSYRIGAVRKRVLAILGLHGEKAPTKK
jgi:DNA-directed RNA polymerase specialized sigma24 family protein